MRFGKRDFSGALSDRSFGEGDNDLGNGELKKGSPEKKKNGGNLITKEEIIDLRKKMEGVRRNYVHRPYDERTEETIRRSSIMYILEILLWNPLERFRRTKDGEGSLKGAEGEFAGSDAGIAGPQMMLSGVNPGAARPEGKYTRTEEAEDTSFSAGGIVKCADGREISFNIDVSMSRRFVRETAVRSALDAVKVCDPLVINLDGNVASVSDRKIRFDIDADGKEDTINSLSSGSGFLAFDKNGDGVINDGSELFGTSSGDGFADLAALDDDGNGWIDEDDDIWNKLKIWVTDENGKTNLYTLARAGVGALCLNSADTGFSLTDDDNRPNAFIRSTGIFLYENGMAGTLQHLDMVASYSS